MASTDGRRRSARGAIAVVLVVVASLLATVAVVGFWAKRNVLDTDRFVDRVAPTIEDPAVQAALAGFVTDQVMTLLDPQAFFEEAFEDRPRAQVLAVPLTAALEGFVNDAVANIIASDTFVQLWETVLERTHNAAVRLLQDEGELVVTEGEEVRLDLLPVVRAVLVRISELSPDVLGLGSALEERIDEDPSDEIAAIESALGVDLDDDFGQVVINDTGRLDRIQQAVRGFEKAVWLLLVAAIAAGAGALYLSRNRRRTGLQLIIGLAIGAVLLRRITFYVQDDVIDAAGTAPSIAALGVVLDNFLAPLQTFAAGALVVLVAVGIGLAITGPYPWAERARGPEWSAWLRDHREVLGLAAVAAGALVLWFGDIGWFWTLVVLALMGGALYVSRRPPPTATATEDAIAPSA